MPENMLLFALGAINGMLVAIVWIALKRNRMAFGQGYFAGRHDESHITMIGWKLIALGKQPLSTEEVIQLMAQQIVKQERMGLPDDWFWDGIDRIALYD